jgi:hypothetical protein
MPSSHTQTRIQTGTHTHTHPPFLPPSVWHPARSGWRRAPPDGMTSQIEREGDANQGRAARSPRGGLISAPLGACGVPCRTCGLRPRL